MYNDIHVYASKHWHREHNILLSPFFSDPNKPLPQESLHGGRVKNRFSELVWPTFDNDGQEYLRIGELSGITTYSIL